MNWQNNCLISVTCTSGSWPLAAINNPPTRTKGRQYSAGNAKIETKH